MILKGWWEFNIQVITGKIVWLSKKNIQYGSDNSGVEGFGHKEVVQNGKMGSGSISLVLGFNALRTFYLLWSVIMKQSNQPWN